MIDLTNTDEIKKLDPKDVFGSTGMLADQCEQIWQDAKTLSFPDTYRQVKNIVISGMGGSSYGGHIVFSLLKEDLKVPVYVNNDYTLPAFVNEETLVILTSYSGSTEETVASAEKAKERSARTVVLTSGSTLAKFAKTNNSPAFVFEPKFNPSGQPRLAPGYIVFGTIAILQNLGLVSLTDEDVNVAITELRANMPTQRTQAQELAKRIQGSIPVIFAAEFLEGNAHIVRNQFNETAKSFSAFSPIPELNHHLMEGLKNPEDKKLIVLMLTSSFYNETIKKRVGLTLDVVEKNTIPSLTYDAHGSSKLSQMLDVLSLGGYITVYLALLYGLDPSLIPWVDYFKEQLKK